MVPFTGLIRSDSFYLEKNKPIATKQKNKKEHGVLTSSTLGAPNTLAEPFPGSNTIVTGTNDK